MRTNSFISAFSKVASGTFLSRILGLVREQVFAYLFGASMPADAFFAAYRIPNLLRDLFAEGALSSAFVPVFKQELQKGGKEKAFELAQISFSVVGLIVAAVAALGALASPWLVRIIAPGFEKIPGKLELTAELTALMFPFLLLVALAALIMSILNSLDRFGIPALASTMFNIGVISAALILCPYMEMPIFGIAIGVLLGGLGQILIQLPSLRKTGFRFKFRPEFKNEGLRKVGKLITPMIGGLAAGRVNIFVNTLVASLLASGSVSYLTYAFRIMHLPLGIIAVGLGTVALPKSSAQAARQDADGMKRTFYRAILLCLFLTLPVIAFFIAAGEQIISLLFEHGRFTAVDTSNTYAALIWFSIGLIGFAGVRVTAPFYYALNDSVLPMRYSIISVVVNLAANALVFIPSLGFAGLALATAIGGIVNFGLLLANLPKKLPGLRLGRIANHFTYLLVGAIAAGALGLSLNETNYVSFGIENQILDQIVQISAIGFYVLIMYCVFCLRYVFFRGDEIREMLKGKSDTNKEPRA